MKLPPDRVKQRCIFLRLEKVLPMSVLRLVRLDDVDNGISVICAGHVSPLEFTSRIDCDDVVELIGDDCDTDENGNPTEEARRDLSGRVRHTWGKWSAEEKSRRWDEVHKDESGSQPFTVIDLN